jgi:hypothetical protein
MAAGQSFFAILSLAFFNSLFSTAATGAGLESAASDATVVLKNTKKRNANLYIKKVFKKII